jgi:hypothetical protein
VILLILNKIQITVSLNNTYMNDICIKYTITIARLATSLIITTALMVNYQNNQVLGISSRL